MELAHSAGCSVVNPEPFWITKESLRAPFRQTNYGTSPTSRCIHVPDGLRPARIWRPMRFVRIVLSDDY